MAGELETKRNIDEFGNLFDARAAFLEGLDQSHALLSDMDTRALERYDALLSPLMLDTNVGAHYISLGEQATEAYVTLYQRASQYEELGLEEDVESKKKDLERQILIGRYAREILWSPGLLIYALEEQDLEDQPSGNGRSDISRRPTPLPELQDNGESTSDTLTIYIDPVKNISVEEQQISISRPKQVSRKFRETQVREFRVNVLKLLASDRDKGYTAQEIWAQTWPGTEVYSSGRWNVFGNKFFTDELTYNGETLVEVDRTDGAHTYKLGKYDLKFENCELVFDHVGVQTVAELEDGTEFSGKAAILFNELLNSSEEDYVTDSVMGVLYTDVELKKLSDQQRHKMFRSKIRQLRHLLKDTTKEIKTISVLNANKKYEAIGYYMTDEAE